MKQGRFIAIIIMVSFLLLLSGTAVVYAQTATPTPPSPAVIESFNIRNVDGSDVTKDYLMAGDTYVISL